MGQRVDTRENYSFWSPQAPGNVRAMNAVTLSILFNTISPTPRTGLGAL